MIGKNKDSKRYKQLKAILVELANSTPNGKITSEDFAANVDGGIFSESSARKWLDKFHADGIIALVDRKDLGGRKVYALNESRLCDNNQGV